MQDIYCRFGEAGLSSNTYISTIFSGRLAGISVKPFPRQSTMLLLQVQADGQLMELALQDGGSACVPEKTINISVKNRYFC